MPTVHKAIFGEVKGAHDLITASPGAPEAVLTELASRYTDRLLPAQISWKPYSCGFPLRGYYVVIRTFPVKATRSGMVQTHAVIVPLDVVGDLTLDCLLDLLPSEPQSTVLNPFPLELSEIPAASRSDVAAPAGYPSLVRMVLNGQVPIWLGQDDFEDVVRFLWQKLWPEARREFKFRISAEPNDLLDLPATLVCTPVELRTNWKIQQFVDLNLGELPDRSLSESYLLGLPDGDALKILRRRLGLFPAQLAGLKRLEQYVYMMAQDTSDSIRTAVRLMKAMFPEPAQCDVEKASLLNSLGQKTIKGTEQDVIALRNLDVSAFSEGPSSLHKMILEWLTRQVAQGRGGVNFGPSALLENHPWKQVADKAVADAFKSWSTNHAQLLWHWWIADSALIAPSEILVPEQLHGVEADLRRSLPINIPSSARSELLSMCSSRRFYLLSSAILLSAPDLSPVDKFRAQLAMLVDRVREVGLPEIANGVSGADLVDVALTIQDARITNLAGQAVTRNPELLEGMDAHDPGWRAVWISAIEKGQGLFDGVRHPTLAAHSVFDAMLAGSIVELVLIEKLAISPSSDLIAYGRRSELWNVLSAGTRQESVTAAAEGWLSRFTGEPGICSCALEPELEQEAIRLWRSTPTRLSPGSLLEFWQRFSSTLTEVDFENWLSSYNSQLTPLEAIGIGKLIHENAWTRASRGVIRRAKSGRNDFLPTVHQLWSSVDLWDKLHFALFTSEPVVEENEWWEAFFELSIKLYPHGIQQKDIWFEADGDESRVKPGAGREQWSDALDLLRKGGAGGSMTVEGLLHQMRNDFYHNPELQLLENVYLNKIRGRR